MGSTSFPGALDGFTTNYSSASPGRQVGPDVDNHAAALNAVETRLWKTHSVYNVVSYGASAGSNSTTAFQAAIDACATAGGGMVYVPPASQAYLISQIKLKTGVWLKGDGYASHLHSIDSNPNTYMVGLNSTDEDEVRVTDMYLSCIAANQTALAGIFFDQTGVSGDSRHEIGRITMYGFKNEGVYFTGATRACFVHDNYILGCDGIGLRFENGATDNVVHGNMIGISGLQGVVDTTASNKYSDCASFYSGRITAASGHGYQISGLRQFMTNCTAQDNKGHGYVIGGSRHILENVSSDSCDTDAFRFDAAADCMVRGFATYGAESAQQHANIVNFVNTPARCHVDVTYQASALQGGGNVVTGSATSSSYSVRLTGAAPTFTST